jgi:hypothetical protein
MGSILKSILVAAAMGIITANTVFAASDEGGKGNDLHGDEATEAKLIVAQEFMPTSLGVCRFYMASGSSVCLRNCASYPNRFSACGNSYREAAIEGGSG